MYIAMNHFRIAADRWEEFERVWRERDSYLDEVPGFVQFHLVRGKDDDDGSHRYASHVVWESASPSTWISFLSQGPKLKKPGDILISMIVSTG